MPQLHYSLWLGPLLIALALLGISPLFGALTLAAIYRVSRHPDSGAARINVRVQAIAAGIAGIP